MFRRIFEHFPWPACRFSRDGSILECNAHMDHLLEEARENGKRTFGEFLVEAERRARNVQFSTYFPQYSKWEYSSYRPNGKVYTVLLVPPALLAAGDDRLRGGEDRIAICIPQETVTPDLNARDELREVRVAADVCQRSLEVRNRLLTIITRDIRSSLNSVVGFADLLKHALAEGDTASCNRLLESITQGSQGTLQQLGRLNRQLKADDDGRVDTRFSLEKLLRELIRDTESYTKEKRIAWNLTSDPEVETIQSDPLYLRLVLGQMLRQTAFSVDHGTTIDVTSGVEQGSLVIRVIQEATTADSVESVSLNPMARDFLTVLGGELGCGRRDDGRITVWFQLPLHAANEEDLATTEVEEPQVWETDQSHVLAIEEDEFNRSMLAGMFRNHDGYSFQTTSSAIEAAEVLTSPMPAVILLGLRTPSKANLTAVKEIREYASEHDIPVVAMINSFGTDSAPHLYSVGFDAILLKPFKRNELLNTLQRVTTGGTGGSRQTAS